MPRISEYSKAPVNEGLTPGSVLKGLIAAYIITVPTFMLFALILVNTDFPHRLISPAVVVTTFISVLTAGTVSTRGIKNKGWLNGGLVGLIYMLILYLFSSLVYKDFSIDKYMITMTAIGVFTGAIGGILGINAKVDTKHKRRQITGK